VSDDQGARVFDMPHARVTLTPASAGVEIEVWPKVGQSAYVVVDPRVAVLIAQQLVELAADRIGAAGLEGDVPATTAADASGSTADEPDAGSSEPKPDNVVDLASRRRPSGRAS
jgi:hypothetical protein